MSVNFNHCKNCPAFFLLTDDGKKLIEKWEYKRNKYLSRIKKVKLILLGESMPSKRYFYDLETDYEDNGLRYTLKKEFGKLELDDSLFLQSLSRKGIVLFDCALCPIHQLDNNTSMRETATYCFLKINQFKILDYPEVPIVTIFPAHRGYLKNEVPESIIERVIGEFSFSDQKGLSDLFEKIKN